MQESFLHFIWQFQYFNKTELTTSDQQVVNIIKPGQHNTDAGPDFKEGKIIIGGLEWNGQVEIHVKASEWVQHSHQSDPAYDNVILHVVWQNDKPATRTDGSIIPTIELKNRIDEELILNYNRLVNSPQQIPCENQIQQVKSITLMTMLDRVLMERLEQKAFEVVRLHQANQNNWEETAYQLLCKNLGFKVNADSFLMLGQSLTYKVIKKHSDNVRQIEALLFGHSDLFNQEVHDAYQTSLIKEYEFLSHKYSLTKVLSSVHWKFLRLRPANFPTIRMAQLAQILKHNPNFFQKFLEVQSLKELKAIVQYPVSDYWQKHYQWGKTSAKPMVQIGISSVENIAINTVAPLMVAYGKLMNNHDYVDRAVKLLEDLKPEKNKITDLWKEMGVDAKSAFDSQSQIHLYNHYCLKKRCLSCNVGLSLVRN